MDFQELIDKERVRAAGLSNLKISRTTNNAETCTIRS